MALEKASIEAYIGDFETVEVLFNPTEHRRSHGNRFTETAIPGLPAPIVQYARGQGRTLSMQLFFDSYEEGIDVRDYSSRVTDLMEIDPELHAPPVIQFNWGDLTFVGVLTKADQSFALFLPDGTPVRATVDISLREWFDPDQQLGRNQSADFAKHYVVRRGDTLASISAAKYGDPALWRHIAEENRLDDPLSIVPGQVLVVPSLR